MLSRCGPTEEEVRHELHPRYRHRTGIRDRPHQRRRDLRQRPRGPALRRRDGLHDGEERRRGRAPARARAACARASGPRRPPRGRSRSGRCSWRSRSSAAACRSCSSSRASPTRRRPRPHSSRRRSSSGWRSSPYHSSTSVSAPLHFAAIALLLAGQIWLAGDAGTVVFGTGEALILAATLLWAVEVVIAKWLLDSVDSRMLGAARMAVGTVVLLGWVAVSGRGGRAVRALGEPVELGAPDGPHPHGVRRDVVRRARPSPGRRRDGGARLRGGRDGRSRPGRGRRPIRPGRCRPGHSRCRCSPRSQGEDEGAPSPAAA